VKNAQYSILPGLTGAAFTVKLRGQSNAYTPFGQFEHAVAAQTLSAPAICSFLSIPFLTNICFMVELPFSHGYENSQIVSGSREGH
jgi:hypothetical protein